MQISKISFAKKGTINQTKIKPQNNVKEHKDYKNLKNSLIILGVAATAVGIAAIAISKNKNNIKPFLHKKTNVPPMQPIGNSTPTKIKKPNGWRLQTDESKRFQGLCFLNKFEEEEKMLKLRTSIFGAEVRQKDIADAFGVNFLDVKHIKQRSPSIFFPKLI